MGRVVYIVEDDPVVRDSIATLVETVGLKPRDYGNATDFLADYDAETPGCVIIDVRLPGMSGLELQAHLLREGIEIPVVIISGHGDISMAVQAMKAGAINFIEKPFREQILLDAVHEAVECDIARRAKRAARAALDEKLSCLTNREREILDRLIVGQATQEVASGLDISPKTVDFHRQNILEKMGVGTTVELVLLCEKLRTQQ